MTASPAQVAYFRSQLRELRYNTRYYPDGPGHAEANELCAAARQDLCMLPQDTVMGLIARAEALNANVASVR